MSGGNWSTDVGLGNPVSGDLTPAPAVRPVENHGANQQAAARRRARQKEKEKKEDADDGHPSAESAEQPEHQLDDLA